MIVLEKKPKINIKKIPKYLIYEELDGKLLPYKGFRDVLKGNKKIEDIMGSSSLQAFIVSIVNFFIAKSINRKKYLVVSNEAGLHVDVGSNLANDIAIYDKFLKLNLPDDVRKVFENNRSASLNKHLPAFSNCK